MVAVSAWLRTLGIAIAGGIIGAGVVGLAVFRELNRDEIRILGHGYWQVFEMELNRPGFWEARAHRYRLFRYRLDLGQTDGWVSVGDDGSASWKTIEGRAVRYDPRRDRVDTLASKHEQP